MDRPEKAVGMSISTGWVIILIHMAEIGGVDAKSTEYVSLQMLDAISLS